LLVAGCLGVLALLACSRDALSRPQWERMSHGDRVLYVQSMIGAEKVKDAKGGGGRTYPLPAEEYVKRIDEAYARGDSRDVPRIFAESSR
jgi:hypothetical protein